MTHRYPRQAKTPCCGVSSRIIRYPDTEMPATSENDRLVRATEAARLLSCDKSTLWRWRKMGVMPEPAKIIPSCVGWRLSTLRRVMNREEASNDDGSE